jgi:hypothetical protein
MQWLQGEDGIWYCAVCAKKHNPKSKGASFDPDQQQRVATKMLHNTYRQHINNVIKVAKIEDEMVPIVWGPAHITADGGYLSAATHYDKHSVEERQGQPHLTSHYNSTQIKTE